MLNFVDRTLGEALNGLKGFEDGFASITIAFYSKSDVLLLQQM
jgi:hypothetical protein